MRGKKIIITSIMAVSMIFIICGTSLAVEPVTKSYTFSAGTAAKASEVNQNFDELYSKVNELVTAVNNLTPVSYSGTLVLANLFASVTTMSITVSPIPGMNDMYSVAGGASKANGGPLNITGVIFGGNPSRLVFTLVPWLDTRCGGETCVPAKIVGGLLSEDGETNIYNGNYTAATDLVAIIGTKNTWTLTGDFPF